MCSLSRQPAESSWTTILLRMSYCSHRASRAGSASTPAASARSWPRSLSRAVSSLSLAALTAVRSSQSSVARSVRYRSSISGSVQLARSVRGERRRRAAKWDGGRIRTVRGASVACGVESGADVGSVEPGVGVAGGEGRTCAVGMRNGDWWCRGSVNAAGSARDGAKAAKSDNGCSGAQPCQQVGGQSFCVGGVGFVEAGLDRGDLLVVGGSSDPLVEWIAAEVEQEWCAGGCDGSDGSRGQDLVAVHVDQPGVCEEVQVDGGLLEAGEPGASAAVISDHGHLRGRDVNDGNGVPDAVEGKAV